MKDLKHLGPSMLRHWNVVFPSACTCDWGVIQGEIVATLNGWKWIGTCYVELWLPDMEQALEQFVVSPCIHFISS